MFMLMIGYIVFSFFLALALYLFVEVPFGALAKAVMSVFM